MYSNVVLDVDSHNFEDILEHYKDGKGYALDTDLKADDWRKVIVEYKAKVQEATGKPFPQEPKDQLWGAIGAVFASWMNARAITYRRLNDIPADWGTAVNVQAMVFGNMGDDLGHRRRLHPQPVDRRERALRRVPGQRAGRGRGGRHPHAAERSPKCAQGRGSDKPSLEALMPEVFEEFVATTKLLEKHYHDMQDIEFTIERGKLWMLQTRNGKRTARAALRIAVDMADEGLIAQRRRGHARRSGRARPAPAPDARSEAPKSAPIATGLPASPGAATGAIVFDGRRRGGRRQGRPQDVILVRVETTPEDIHGMHAAEGILTTRGGMTCHAAVVARGMGKPCVAGAGSIRIDYAQGDDDRRRRHAQEGRHHHHRRRARRGDPGRGADDQAGSHRRFRRR